MMTVKADLLAGVGAGALMLVAPVPTMPETPVPVRSDGRTAATASRPKAPGSEQSFHDGHAGQRPRRERLPRPGRWPATLKHPVTLPGVEGGEVESGGQRQGRQLDPVIP
jgi:hypothetical protein